jgi:hypothetical protein
MADEEIQNLDDLAKTLGALEPENPNSTDQVKAALEEEEKKQGS